MTPSSHYIESLIKVILECKSETEFESFYMFIGGLDINGHTGNDYLIEALRSL